MKGVLVAATAIMLASAGVAQAAGIAGASWDKSNIGALSATGKADVVQLLDDVTDFGNLHPCACVKPTDVGEFTWADLAGDGREELVLTRDVNGRQFFNALDIFRRDDSGKVTYQELEGWMIRDLQAVIRDLNGDGRDELIIPTVLFQYNTAATISWPVVYRPEGGKYVQASQNFPAYYDSEVLPQLDGQIAAIRGRISSGRASQGTLAPVLMVRNKILRTLGRNPTAGLQQAYQWMNTDDPFLLLAAAATFEDIGGHREEISAARAGYARAVCERNPGMVMCRNLPGSGAPNTP